MNASLITKGQSMEKCLTEQRSGVHSRVGWGLANRGLSAALLQMADVSASSTSCRQALRNRVNQNVALEFFTVTFPHYRRALAAWLYLRARCLLVSSSLSHVSTLPPVPGAVRIPGEDALAAALIIRAVSDGDVHQFREGGHVKPTLWGRDDKRGVRKEVAPQKVEISSRSVRLQRK